MKTNKTTDKFPDLNPDERLKEMMLYIAERCQDHVLFGAIKLNKILYFSDMLSYRKRGKPITGSEYQKLPQGPAPRRLVPVREELLAASEAVIQNRTLIDGKTQKRLIPLRVADISKFSSDEIDFVSRVIEILENHSAETVSKISHDLAWEVADEGETIPYESVFIGNCNPDFVDIEDAKLLFAV